MSSLSIVVTSQIKLIPTPSWLVYFVLKAQPFFINFAVNQWKGVKTEQKWIFNLLKNLIGGVKSESTSSEILVSPDHLVKKNIFMGTEVWPVL